MKIILLEDVPKLGVTGDIVNVKPGYANNYLIRFKKALPGTKENLERAEEIRLEQAKINAENKAAGEALAELINETVVEIPAKAGAEGKLFGSVTTKDIAQALKEQKDINIDKRKVILSEPIRSLGEQEVRVRTYPEVEATLKVNVVEE